MSKLENKTTITVIYSGGRIIIADVCKTSDELINEVVKELNDKKDRTLILQSTTKTVILNTDNVVAVQVESEENK
jgi:hypothetical protein